MTGALRRDEDAADTLYLRFHVSPLSEGPEQEAEIELELWQGHRPHLRIGKARGAVGYSVSYQRRGATEGASATEMRDLNSARPEPEALQQGLRFEMPRRGRARTFVVKIQFIPDSDDLVTVWLDPDLGPGANELHQPDTLTTRFYARATFDRLLLRCENSSAPWWFSDLALATAFTDFVDISSAQPLASATPIPSGLAFDIDHWPLVHQDQPLSPSALAVSPEGYLWLGSEEGLFRFDGRRLVRVQPEQVPLRAIRHLAADSTGALWIATAEGKLGRLTRNLWQNCPLPLASQPPSLRALITDRTGQLWLATTTEVWLWQGTQWRPIPQTPPSTNEIVTLLPNPDGGIWRVSAQGPLELLAGNPSRSLPRPSEPDPARWLAWSTDASGHLWLATPDRVLQINPKDDAPQWQTAWQAPTSDRITGLFPQPQDGVWVVLASGEWISLWPNRPPGPRTQILSPADELRLTLRDHDGTVWLTRDATLVRVRPRWRTVFGPKDGLANRPITGMAEVAPGTVWVAQAGNGLLRWTGNHFARLTVAGLTAASPNNPELVWTASDGSCWVATEAGLLRFRDPQAVADEFQLVGLEGRTIRVLAEAPDGAIWAGTKEGELWRLHQGQWHPQPQPWGPIPISTLVWDTTNLWIRTLGAGLFHRTEQAPDQPQPVKDFLPRQVFTMIRCHKGTLWAGTEAGLWHRNTHGWTAVPIKAAHQPVPVQALIEDTLGRLWLGAPMGLACWRPERSGTELSVPQGAWWPWSDNAGMPRNPHSPPSPPAALPVLRTESGKLWIALGDRITVVEPTRQTDARRPMRIFVEKVRGKDRILFELRGPPGPDDAFYPGPSRPLRLPPGTQSMELEFSVLNVPHPDDLRVAYRLEEIDPDWREAGHARTASYGHLPPDRYHFRVRASTEPARADTAETQLAFVVPPYPWQRPWFTGTTLLALLLTGSALARA